MAKAIRQIEKNQKSEVEQQAESLQELLTMISKNSEAIKSTLEILQELQKAGILDMINGLLKTKDKVGVIAMDQLNQPSMHRTIKNGINALQFIGELDPDKMKRMMHGINTGLDHLNDEAQQNKIGILKAMRDPNVKASISTAFSFLQGMGEGLENNKHGLH
jgi:uncharacterized protein YjgD (DUF1641 family)